MLGNWLYVNTTCTTLNPVIKASEENHIEFDQQLWGQIFKIKNTEFMSSGEHKLGVKCNWKSSDKLGLE